MSGMSFDFGDMVEFQKNLKRVGDLPQKVVSRAAGKGATVAGRAIRAAAPKGKTKQLSKGFKRYRERTKLKGKKVYYYAMDDAKNEIFQKAIPAKSAKHPGERKSKWDHAYYPASVEYGFLTRSKGGGLSYVEGQHFVRDSAESVRLQVERTITQVLTAELDKVWREMK